MLARTSHLTPRLAHRVFTSSTRSIHNPPSPAKTYVPDTQVKSTTARHPPENKIATNDPNPRSDVPPTQGSATAPEAHPRANMLDSDSGGMQDAMLKEMDKPEEARVMQAPNRASVWSRSQQPRERAMTGPRFEQTMMEYQPRPMAAIELIHKQPVRWTHDRLAACDGAGGGPLGHPRIYINVDKPQICHCTYCGLPYANVHHRKYLESLPQTSYPLDPTNDPAVVDEGMKVSDEPFHNR